VAGKPAGIALAAWLAVRAGLADLPAGVGGRQILGAGALAGIGFTMSLFVSNLAFDSEALAAEAKSAIFVASIASGLLGYAALRWWAPAAAENG
jgi:NhaA family Na+:H+ antiporter